MSTSEHSVSFVEQVPLGDFTASPRMIFIALLAAAIGVLGAGLAYVLLRLIAFFTNLFFYHRLSTAPSMPVGHDLGIFVILVPVIGAAIVGLMARYGSDRIRGHGIPEAIEAILMGGSRVEPKLVLLKPLSSAISIGSGGPFGAEGPIIMTAGSFGSMIAQFFHLTDAERKTLLVAGAAAGMSATFATPVAAVLLAVELLLFEWKPRSFVPVAVASIAAFAVRHFILGSGPLFPVPPHPAFVGLGGLGWCFLVGLAGGILSAILTRLVYWSEDTFAKLPIHWMWWPPIGGLVIGIGGYFFPRALGVGYETIGQFLQGATTTSVLVGVLVVKSLIWSISLGSGTSGGVLAPLLMIGGALGGVEALALPSHGVGFWPLVSMAAVLGGTMRSPLTAVIFALELTHDINMMAPLLVAVVAAHAFTVLVLSRSILTEKVSRRGYHLSREYAVDPLEILFVRDVMPERSEVLSIDVSWDELAQVVEQADRRQELFPVVDAGGALADVRSRHEIETMMRQREGMPAPFAGKLVRRPVVATFPDEPLRVAVHRMAESGFIRMPVVSPNDRRTVVGLVTLEDMLKARTANLAAERKRERHLELWLPLGPFGGGGDDEEEEAAPVRRRGSA